MKKQKALLVIDMQKGCFTPQTPRFDAVGLIDRINSLAAIFRRAGYPIIFIQHDGTREHELIPNTEAWELLSELDKQPGDMVISKTANDAFYRTELSSELHTQGISELFITGCATDFCVEATVQSALTKDYTVTVVEDGHTTAPRPHLDAEQLITHYNWVWKQLTPTQGSIKVLPVEQIKIAIG